MACSGPPTFDTRLGYWLGLTYLALAASVLTFSLYYPVVRRIGPAKAAYSSVIVPVSTRPRESVWLKSAVIVCTLLRCAWTAARSGDGAGAAARTAGASSASKGDRDKGIPNSRKIQPSARVGELNTS